MCRGLCVCLRMYVCLSVCWSQPWALQKRMNRSRCRLGYGVRWDKKPCIRWGPRYPPGKETIFGASPGPLIYREYLAYGWYFEPYSIGGSDATFRCQYCSNLMLLLQLQEACEVLLSACLSVCLSVWMSACTSRKPHLTNMSAHVTCSVARSYSDDNAIRYVLPVCG